MTNILTIVVLFGLLQGLMLLYVFSRKTRIQRHRYFLFFIVALLFVQTHSFLVRSGWMEDLLFMMNTNVPVIFLFGPLLYFNTRQLLEQRTRRSMLITVLHLLPFLLYTAYSFNFFLQDVNFKFNAYNELASLEAPMKPFVQHFESDPWDIQGWVVVEIVCLHVIIYAISSILLVLRSKPNFKRSSSVRSWSLFLNLVLLVGGLILFLSEGGIINGHVFFESPLARFSGDLFSTVALYVTTFYLLARPHFLNEKSNKYEKSTLLSDYKEDKLEKIVHAFEVEKLFKNSDFSLDLLSKSVGLSKHHISQIINEELKCSFSELTNSYRIEEAKRMLENSGFVKMEALAYDLGYRSKTSFFNAFKHRTSLTPANYRKAILG